MKRREQQQSASKETQLWEEVLRNLEAASPTPNYVKHSRDYMKHSVVDGVNKTSVDKMQHVMSCHPYHKKVANYLFDELK